MYIVVATKATTNNIACSTVIVKINNEDDATDVNYNNEFKVSFLEKSANRIIVQDDNKIYGTAFFSIFFI